MKNLFPLLSLYFNKFFVFPSICVHTREGEKKLSLMKGDENLIKEVSETFISEGGGRIGVGGNI
jgi:hypothetical protein